MKSVDQTGGKTTKITKQIHMTEVKSTDKSGANHIQREENTGRLKKKYKYHELNKFPTWINFSKCF